MDGQGAVSGDASILKLGEKRQNLLPAGIFEAVPRLRSGMEAFAQTALGPDQFVLVEHQVKIGHKAARLQYDIVGR